MADQVPVQSWWWCKHCHEFVGLRDPGEPYPHCDECGSPVHLREPACEDLRLAPAAAQVRAPLPDLDWHLEAKPIVKPKFKPGQKRKRLDLRELATTGFWFCYSDACKNIVERTEDGLCACCGEELVEEINWRPPIFPEGLNPRRAAA